MSIVIRKAKPEDSCQITLLTQELGYSSEEGQTHEWLQALLESNNHAVYVASSESNDLYGWLVVEKRVSLETGYKAEISGLVVNTKFRRSGIGKNLVLAAAAWAKQRNLYKLVVRSNIKRDASHIFYPNIGFSLSKTSHTYELNLQA